ncbi:ABC transporter permease [uncultured Sneathiella sp.]|uniref:ABC transporter permease n=1 Tax=uncultured Sneathiella sp. TaxID=879315 RepID=UPI0025994704|nr:ABC transporter permease [uncultured Sneathiella sp.]
MSADLLTFLGAWSIATLRSATPLIFTTLGETLTQRTGVINLGIEGEMLVGACVGFAVGVATGNPWLGLLAGGLAGATLSCLHAALVLGANANQIGSGLAVWMVSLGITSYFGRALVGNQVTPLPDLGSPLTDGVPFLGIFFGQMTMSVPLAVAAVVFAAWWLAHTRTGIQWQAVGESARISSENGIRPKIVRFKAILLGGLLSGFGGAILSVDYTQTWAQDMTKGRGLIAVGLVIVARWKPALVLPICIIFGLAEVAVLRMQTAGWSISPHLLATTPYLVVLFILIINHAVARRDTNMPADLKRVFA